MSKLFSLLLLTPFLWVMVYQDSLNDVEELRGEMAEQTIQRATELAAVNGYFTDEMVKQIEEDLMAVGYDKEEIELKVNTDPKVRGEYVEGTVKVPNKYTNILMRSFFDPNNQDDLKHISSASRMSEAIN